MGLEMAQRCGAVVDGCPFAYHSSPEIPANWYPEPRGLYRPTLPEVATPRMQVAEMPGGGFPGRHRTGAIFGGIALMQITIDGLDLGAYIEALVAAKVTEALTITDADPWLAAP